MATGAATNPPHEVLDYAAENAEQGLRAAHYGMNWLVDITEQNLEQSRAAFAGYLTTVRKAMDSIDQQAFHIRERSLALAEATLANTFDFAHRACRVKDTHEFVAVQTDFLGRQAQAVAEQAREFGQNLAQGAEAVTSTTARLAASVGLGAGMG